MRMLWSLPTAAPALLRHLAAYAELACLDLARAQREITARLLAGAIVVVCLLFALVMGCLAVVAYTWDTPQRVSAIAWIGGGFLAVAVLVGAYRAFAARGQLAFLASVRREWAEDRVLLDRILSSDPE